MRVSGQLAVIAMLGAAGIGGWYAYKGGHLAKIPVIGAYVSQPAEQQAAQGGRGRGGAAGPATVDVDTVKTGRIVEMRESVGTVRAYESITVTAKVAGIVSEIGFNEGQKVKAGDMLVQFDAAERRAEIEQAIAEANAPKPSGTKSPSSSTAPRRSAAPAPAPALRSRISRPRSSPSMAPSPPPAPSARRRKPGSKI